MARGMRSEVESTDYLNPELNGVIEFEHIRRSGMVMIEPVTDREFAIHTQEGRNDYEAFMNERIVIKIHETTNENEPPFAFVGDNGECVWIPRGRPVRLPRKFVETLARSQQRIYSQTEDPNPKADEGMITRRRTGAAYPFSVIEDKNARGRAWLQRVTHESA